MKRFLSFLFLLMAIPGLAWGSPQISGPQQAYGSAQITTVTFKISDTEDSPAIPVSGTCSVRYSQASGDDANLYSIPTATTAASSGTLLASFTASTSTPVTFRAGTLWVKAVATDATAGGSVMVIHCSNSEIAAGSGGSSIIGWPSFELIGGTRRPTQAIVLDSLIFGSKLSGAGKDVDGSTWDGSCTANATTDQPCTRTTDTVAGLQISIDQGTAALGTTIDIDVTDPQAAFYSRDSVSFAHEIGTANDTCIAADGDYVAAVLFDDSADTYRIVSTYTGALNCTTPSGQLSVGGSLGYGTTTSDKLMPFIMDAVHLSPYGSRWTAQEVLTAAWEDQYPEMLGLTNLITNGYMETNCSGGTPFTFSTGSGATLAGATVTPNGYPSVGAGCTWTPDATGGTATTATISAVPGEWYTGSIQLGQGTVASTTRNITLKIQDSAGTSIANSAFWIGGQLSGIQAEPIATTDGAADNTPGEVTLTELETYGDMTTIKFKFQVPAGVTGFKVQVLQPDVATQFPVRIDELWVRKSVHADLNRHYIIADGKAHIQLFTDSRGLTSRDEALQDSFDYMLGETTKSGYSRASGSLRPNLHLDEKVSQNTYTVSGQKLGWYVGENDSYKTYSGTATTNPHIDTLIDSTTNYCMAYYGINDLTAGARPTSASINSDTGNEYLYWADQLRGFEIAAEKAGCIPIVIMEPVTRGDTTTTTCSDASGSALNCATWHQRAWRDILHFGVPTS